MYLNLCSISVFEKMAQIKDIVVIARVLPKQSHSDCRVGSTLLAMTSEHKKAAEAAFLDEFHS
jgi:hypothetical protein